MPQITNTYNEIGPIKILRPEGRRLPSIVFASAQYQRRITEVLWADRQTFNDCPGEKHFFRHQLFGGFGAMTGVEEDLVCVIDRGHSKSIRVPYQADMSSGKQTPTDVAVCAFRDDPLMYVVNRRTFELIRRVYIGKWWEEKQEGSIKERGVDLK